VNERFEICHHAIMSGMSNTRPAARRIICGEGTQLVAYVGSGTELRHMDPLNGALELIGALVAIGVVLFLLVPNASR
jgi:hypothetical protein